MIGIFSVKVSAANLSYSYVNSKKSTNRGYSYLSSATIYMRELVAKRFNVAGSTAQILINNAKGKDKDAESKPKKEKTSEDKGKALVKQLKKTYEFLYDYKDEIEDDTLVEIRTYISDIESII